MAHPARAKLPTVPKGGKGHRPPRLRARLLASPSDQESLISLLHWQRVENVNLLGRKETRSDLFPSESRLSGHNAVESPLESSAVQWTLYIHGAGNVVDRAGWVKLIQKPEPFLAKRKCTRPLGSSARDRSSRGACWRVSVKPPLQEGESFGIESRDLFSKVTHK